MSTPPHPAPDDEDVVRAFPQLAPLARPTVLLHPQRVTDPLPPHVSKIGGRLLWPADDPWPTCQVPEEIVISVGPLPQERLTTWDQIWSRRPHRVNVSYQGAWAAVDDPLHNDHFVAVLQLRRAEVPLLPFPAGTDLFQLLWCPRAHGGAPGYEDNAQPLCRVYWRTERTIGRLRMTVPVPAQPDRTLVPHECALAPEVAWDYPALIEIEDTDEDLAEALAAWCQALPSAAHQAAALRGLGRAGTKVGGYPAWTQYVCPVVCPQGHPMEHLLTLDSAEPPTSRTSMDDDPPEQRGRSRAWRPEEWAPTGLEVGRHGRLFLFMCPACTDRPIASVIQ